MTSPKRLLFDRRTDRKRPRLALGPNPSLPRTRPSSQHPRPTPSTSLAFATSRANSADKTLPRLPLRFEITIVATVTSWRAATGFVPSRFIDGP
jgi:hypothetical protein